MMKTTTVQRREILKQCACMAGVLATGCATTVLLDGCSGSARTTTGDQQWALDVDVRTLAENGDRLVTAERGPDRAHILIVRVDETRFDAVSMRCTHAGVELDPPKDGRMRCRGHGSFFDLHGNPISGPAVESGPLQRYNVVRDAEGSTIHLTQL